MIVERQKWERCGMDYHRQERRRAFFIYVSRSLTVERTVDTCEVQFKSGKG